MKKVLLVILAIAILAFSGCGKKQVKNPAASPTPSSAQQQQNNNNTNTKTTPKTQVTKEDMNNFQALEKQYEKTKDPAERKALLAKMQVILDKVETQSKTKK